MAGELRSAQAAACAPFARPWRFFGAIMRRALWTPPGICGRSVPRPLRFSRRRATFAPRPRNPRAAGLPRHLIHPLLRAPERVRSHEDYRRACRASQVAGPCPPGGGAAQHHPDPRQRADQGRRRQAQPEGHRPRSRSHRHDRRRGGARRRHHRAGAHVLRDRAQAAGGRADRHRGLRRPRRALDPRRALALHAADPAGKRFPRPRRRRDEPHLQARRPPTSSG